jgi:hypothetical protein
MLNNMIYLFFELQGLDGCAEVVVDNNDVVGGWI